MVQSQTVLSGDPSQSDIKPVHACCYNSCKCYHGILDSILKTWLRPRKAASWSRTTGCCFLVARYPAAVTSTSSWATARMRVTYGACPASRDKAGMHSSVSGIKHDPFLSGMLLQLYEVSWSDISPGTIPLSLANSRQTVIKQH